MTKQLSIAGIKSQNDIWAMGLYLMNTTFLFYLSFDNICLKLQDFYEKKMS